MTFKPAIWYPISSVLTFLNLAGVGFAAYAAEPLHATMHGGLAIAFGVWAQHLRNAKQSQSNASLEAIDAEVSRLREELTELQERQDFTERMLAQESEMRRMGPPR